MMTLKITGDKAILRKLKGLVPAARRKVLSQAARTAMKPVLQQAKANAPVESGALRKAIKMRALKRNRKGYVGMKVAVAAKWYVGKTFYGAFQEFGWKAGKRPGKNSDVSDNRAEIPGKHYMEQAYQSGGEKAMRSFLEEVPRGIEKMMAVGGTK